MCTGLFMNKKKIKINPINPMHFHICCIIENMKNDPLKTCNFNLFFYLKKLFSRNLDEN